MMRYNLTRSFRAKKLNQTQLTEDISETSVGADIRALRKSREIRLIKLAEALSRSTGWLSQIERGQTEPSISDLRNIAAYFDIPLSFFFRNEQARDGEQGFIVRKSTRAELGSRQDGLVEELLSPHLSGDFEMIRSEFAANSISDWIPPRPAQEGGYLVSGKMNLWLNNRKFELSAGDSFQFENEKYRWENPTDNLAVAIWVISPPVY
jgi:transcriptional regulator with XRE-family HTH domain